MGAVSVTQQEKQTLPVGWEKMFLLSWRKKNTKRLNCIPKIVQFTLHIWQQKQKKQFIIQGFHANDRFLVLEGATSFWYAFLINILTVH